MSLTRHFNELIGHWIYKSHLKHFFRWIITYGFDSWWYDCLKVHIISSLLTSLLTHSTPIDVFQVCFTKLCYLLAMRLSASPESRCGHYATGDFSALGHGTRCPVWLCNGLATKCRPPECDALHRSFLLKGHGHLFAAENYISPPYCKIWDS